MICLRNHLTGEWLLRPAARRFFFLASMCAVVFWLLKLFAVLVWKGPSAMSPVLDLLLIATIAAGALSWSSIYLGMLYYWFVHDRGQKIGRNWWFLFLIASPLFSILYYFIAYRSDLETSSGIVINDERRNLMI